MHKRLGLCLGFALIVSQVSLAAGPCDVAALAEKARQECAAKNDGSCFIYTTLIDNKNAWKMIEQTCLAECKGNPAGCGKYQQLGKQLMMSRCAVDPDACALKNQLNGQQPGS